MPDMIDLGREMDSGPCCDSETKDGKKKIYYPSLYITGIKGLSLDTGEITFTAKGKVVSVSKRDEDGDYEDDDDSDEEYSCEIEVHKISIPGATKDDSGDGLDGALDKIAKDKTEDTEEDDEE